LSVIAVIGGEKAGSGRDLLASPVIRQEVEGELTRSGRDALAKGEKELKIGCAGWIGFFVGGEEAFVKQGQSASSLPNAREVPVHPKTIRKKSGGLSSEGHMRDVVPGKSHRFHRPAAVSSPGRKRKMSFAGKKK